NRENGLSITLASTMISDMRIKLIVLSFLFCAFSAVSAQNKSSIYPVALTCEYLDHPVGLDIKQPRFSWKLAAADDSAFAQKQTAYRIVVSSAKDKLNKNKADIWNSGWVMSRESQLIPYKGQ